MTRPRHRNRCRGDEPGGTDAVAQASSSRSTGDGSPLEPKHKIFLSHSGAQKGFVEQLCVDLERCDRHPFFDRRWDSLPKGRDFPPRIFEAIEQCQVGVVIFSEEFFSRTKWPMLELVAMAKRTDKEFTLLPVFLTISRAQSRDPAKQAEWLQLWKKWAKVDKRIKVEEWKQALALLGPRNAFVYEDGTSEVKFREDVVEGICRYVRPETRWDDSDVQGRARICKVIRKRAESTPVAKNYGAVVVGLYGVGGIGKTTICKALCNDFMTELQGRVCHVEFESESKLDLLQRVLRRLSDVKLEVLGKLEEGECRDLLKRNVYKHKVFLAIDNVSDTVESLEQARAFLNAGFKPGSVVVVTARSLGQLKCLNISDSDCFEMPELEVGEARALFLSQIAGVPSSVDVNDEEHVMRCVRHCEFYKGEGDAKHYHPLALKVLGLQLGSLGYDPKQWVVELNKDYDTFNQLQNNVHPVFSILRRSFDRLQSQDQLLFMDAALYSPSIMFLQDPGWLNLNILDWLSIVHGISVDAVTRRLEGLKRKSLLENLGDGYARIRMHDLWREFAVMETRVGELKQRRWLYEVEVDRSGYEEVDMDGGRWESLKRMCLSKKGLQSLQDLIDFQCFSSATVLHVKGEPKRKQVLDLAPLKLLRSLSLVFKYKSNEVEVVGLGSLKNLRLLILEVWDAEISAACIEEIESLSSLQILVLSARHGDRLPNLSALTSLREVHFKGFAGVETVCGLSPPLTSLQHLSIREARSLRSCPGVGDALGLEVLDFDGCWKLEVLPSLQKLKKLRTLNISYCCPLKGLPGLDGLISLQSLDAGGCYGLVAFPDMSKLSLLRVLDVSDCPVKAMPGLSELIGLQELRGEFEGMKHEPSLHKLTKLSTLSIRGWGAQGLPCLIRLTSLKNLRILCCDGVDELVGIGHLTCLHKLEVSDCDFKEMSVLSSLTSLEELEICECPKLERLSGLHPLTRLKRLEVKSCGSLQTLAGIGTLPELETFRCYRSKITAVPDFSKFPRLKVLHLSDCECLLSLGCTGPLTAVTNLYVSHCRSFEVLPDLSCSRDLEQLILTGSGVKFSEHDIQELVAKCCQLRSVRAAGIEYSR